MGFTRVLKRLLILVSCLAGSGIAPFLAIFALKDAARFGLGLVVLGSWLLALLALLFIAFAWVSNARLGRLAAVAACILGVTALLSYPILAAVAGERRWLSEFAGAFGMELLAVSPCVILAGYLAAYHASEANESAA